jgi:signal peptide peptidase SppA
VTEEAPKVDLAPAMPGPSLIHIADRVLGRPLLLHPTKAEVVLHILEGRLPLDGALAPLGPEANRFTGNNITRNGTTVRQDGVAIISVIGSLVNRGAWLGARSGMTSYEGLTAQIRDARYDPKVKAILLDLDSPGGEATGMFTVAAAVREAAQDKPVVAVVNDMAASAAYGIASQATEIVVSPTSLVGSIGVVLTHLDRSGELQAKGIKPTLIYAGRHKVDGNPYGPLSDAVRADLQTEVAKFYDQFVGLVAQGRGDRLTEADARATEARTFIGQEAIERGLADRVASFDAVLASLQSETQGPSGAGNKGGRKMADNPTTAPAAGISQEAHTAAVAAARAEGVTEGKRLGAEEATTRIGAILGSEEAKANPALAAHFAFKTSMDADAAKEALKAAGPAAAPAASAPAQPTIEQRQKEAGDFGPAAGPVNSGAGKSASGWSKAVADANASIGVKRQ